MNLLLNVLWVIFGGGILIWLEYVLAGLLLCVTIVGIPFGMQCFKIAGLGLWPFGKDIQESKPGPMGTGLLKSIMNVVWLLFAGIWIFLSHLGLGVGLAVTIIGIPFAIQHLKLAILALFPFGREVR
ncbi:MAG: YccF domain-containing protein [Deltaproteobacteria bacterium]|nr:YccF domain-containing protein [Deltaproteobacteria bacterium]